MHLAARRVGTVNTRGRADVAGSGKKLFRQKGTGNARAGSKRTNKRKGGGVAFARRNRDYRYSMPKKAVRAAVRMALLSKFQDRQALVLDGLSLSQAQDQGGRQDLPGDPPARPERGRSGRVGRRDQGPGPASGRSSARSILFGLPRTTRSFTAVPATSKASRSPRWPSSTPTTSSSSATWSSPARPSPPSRNRSSRNRSGAVRSPERVLDRPDSHPES